MSGAFAAGRRRVVLLIIRVHSLEFHEADLGGLLSETTTADHQVVLSDEAFLVGANSACAGVLSELAGVRFQLVWHSSLF